MSVKYDRQTWVEGEKGSTFSNAICSFESLETFWLTPSLQMIETTYDYAVPLMSRQQMLNPIVLKARDSIVRIGHFIDNVRNARAKLAIRRDIPSQGEVDFYDVAARSVEDTIRNDLVLETTTNYVALQQYCTTIGIPDAVEDRNNDDDD